jgi:hypothetical protein
LTVKGKRFVSIPEIEAATTTRLKGLTKDDFQKCFKKWQERCNKCVTSQGDYCEGDWLIFVFGLIIFSIRTFTIFSDHTSYIDWNMWYVNVHSNVRPAYMSQEGK